MSRLFLILSSIIFPILLIIWLGCLAFCIYKALIRHLKKPGRNTKVQIVVSDTRASSMGLESDDLGSTNTSERSNNSRDTTRNSFIPRLFPWLRNSSRVSNEESRHNHLYDNHSVTIPDVEVNSTVNSSNFLNSSGGSLLLSDAIREARRTRTSLKSMKTDKEINTEPLYYPKWPQSVIDPLEDRHQSILAPLKAPWPLLKPQQPSASLPPSVRHFLESQQQPHHHY